jgi:hypothetical protein
MFYADFCCGKKKWGKGWEIWMLCGKHIPGMFHLLILPSCSIVSSKAAMRLER